MGFTSGPTINRDLSGSGSNPLNIAIGGSINPIDSTSSNLNISLGGTPNSLPSHGSSIQRRSYRKSAPYADPHIIDPIIFTGADELCKDHKTMEDGDYYCQKVDQIIYNNVSNTGEYKEVVYMNQDTGECRFAEVNRTFSGEMAPFNEPVSLSFLFFPLLLFFLFLPIFPPNSLCSLHAHLLSSSPSS